MILFWRLLHTQFVWSMSWYSLPTTFASCCVLLLSNLPSIYTFTPYSSIHCTPKQNPTLPRRITSLAAKRKRDRDKNNDITSSWYDNVDEGATPDDVFWEEMERQRSIAGVVPEVSGGTDGGFGAGAGVPMDPLSAIASNANASGGGGKASNQQIQQLQSQQEPSIPAKETSAWKDSNAGTGGVAGGINTEKVLGSYASFMVSDNWINEDYKAEHEESLEMQDISLNQQLDEWSQESDDDDDDEFDPARSSEPWDFWRDEGEIVETDEDGDEIVERIDMEKGAFSGHMKI